MPTPVEPRTRSAVSPDARADAANAQTTPAAPPRRYPVGAEYLGDGRTHFRVWAPATRTVSVAFDAGHTTALDAEGDGYFSGVIAAPIGSRYQFTLDSGDRPYPDPASRFQPDGPHGSSEVIDPLSFAWTDQSWAGVTIEGQVIYEMHLGTFTREGTWAAAERELTELAAIGVTTLELMPAADFPGRFGWGYDGVNLWAPTRLYGRPDDFRRFVDRAHAVGLGVILDVVYNHVGPSGNYLRAFAPAYFSQRYDNEWGDAINFDGADAAPVREYFAGNAAYWIDEFHLDGLRLDATQQIFDSSPDHILRLIGVSVRGAARGRSTIVVAENEPQESRLVRPAADGGYELDGLWNDDFHHSAMVALTGRAEAYYTDTRGEPQEFVSAAKFGYLFQGQHYSWQRQPRGTPCWGVPPARFITFLQNHDQVANAAAGLRGSALTSPAKWRAMTALLLLMPGTPMLFQGQEFAASAPFLYFADHEPGLAAAVREGRAGFLRQFPSLVDFEAKAAIDDPADRRTFERCRLDLTERERHAAAYLLHIDLLKLRRSEAAFRAQRPGGVDGSVLAPAAFALRFFSERHADDRLLLVNLGAILERESFADPLMAPPSGSDWTLQWSSEEPTYGGGGTADVLPDGGWRIPPEAAIVLRPGARRPAPPVIIRRRSA
ncbi:MAG: malto-oligosyltrehalose trehalohydrolase [Acidobacteriota bacterium]